MRHSPAERPFVGRGVELDVLAAHVAAADASRGRLVLVSGEAGAGKTHLVMRATAGLPASRVVWGRCAEIEGAPAFWPWMQVLRRHVEGVTPERRRELVEASGPTVGRLVPALGVHVDPPGIDPESARFRLFEDTANFLRAAAADALLVVVLDDLHWADSESLLLLRFLAPHLIDGRLLILGTHRDVDSSHTESTLRLVGDLARMSHRVPIRGLPRVDVASYAAIVTGRPVTDELAGAIHRATAGNAFFLAEVVQLLMEAGDLDHARIGHRIHLPDGVREAVRRRVGSLVPETRQVLDHAAIVGSDFDLAVVVHLTGLPVATVLDLLDPAVVAGVVAPVPDMPGRWRFAHALVADTMAGDLDASTRATMHRRAAEALAVVHAADLESNLGEIAHHYFEAAPLGTLPAAIDYATRAGQRAFVALGYEEAAGHFERALQASRAAALEPAEHLRLLIAFGEAQLAAADENGAIASLTEAMQLARALGERQRFADALRAFSPLAERLPMPNPTIIRLVEEVLAETAIDSPDRVVLLSELSRLVYFADTTRRHALSAEALDLARGVGDERTRYAALQARRIALSEPGRTAERMALGDEAGALMEAVGSPVALAQEYQWRIYDHLELGDMTVVDDAVRRYRELAERTRLPILRWHVTTIDAMLAYHGGRLDESDALAQRAIGLCSSRLVGLKAAYVLQRGLVAVERGRLADEPLGMEEAQQDAEPIAWRAGLAIMHVTLGQHESARQVVAQLAARGFEDLPRHANLTGAWAFLADVCAQLGDRETAALLLPLVAPHAESVVVFAMAAACLGSAARFAGLLARTTGRLDDAVTYLERAVAVNARIGALVQLAHSRLDLGVALRARDARGDREQAADCIDAAATAASRLGLVALQARIPVDGPASPISMPPIEAAETTRVATLERRGDVWLFACGEEQTLLKDTKGIAYLGQLFGQPGREIHALDFGGMVDLGTGDTGELLDATARRSYRERLATLREELAEAEGFNDLGRIERLRDEMDVLADELTRASGLGGRSRKTGTDAERARLNVSRAIRGVIRRVGAECPNLGRYLERSVRTGIFCSYEPDPALLPIRWEVRM